MHQTVERVHVPAFRYSWRQLYLLESSLTTKIGNLVHVLEHAFSLHLGVLHYNAMIVLQLLSHLWGTYVKLVMGSQY